MQKRPITLYHSGDYTRDRFPVAPIGYPIAFWGKCLSILHCCHLAPFILIVFQLKIKYSVVEGYPWLTMSRKNSSFFFFFFSLVWCFIFYCGFINFFNFKSKIRLLKVSVYTWLTIIRKNNSFFLFGILFFVAVLFA